MQPKLINTHGAVESEGSRAFALVAVGTGRLAIRSEHEEMNAALLLRELDCFPQNEVVAEVIAGLSLLYDDHGGVGHAFFDDTDPILI